MSTAKYATPRNLANPSFGERLEAVAEFFGSPLMPWQKQVASVALELDPENPGAWRYPLVVVSVPRQAGKTYLLRALMVDRLMCYRAHEIMMTAQTGKDARKRWEQICTSLDVEKYPTRFKKRRSQGTERLEDKLQLSFISPFAPTPKAVHGDSLHLVTIDEAWAFDTESGYALENAINPTQLTVKDCQIWIVSTRGTANSTYLNALIEKGRAAVNDPGSQMAYFEWSADEKLAEQNPYSDETLAFHPALGYTQTADKMRSLAAGSSLASWRRSILNLETLDNVTVIDMAIWESAADPERVAATKPKLSKVHLAFDIAHDGSAATVAAAWKDPDNPGEIITQIIIRKAGTDWVRPLLGKSARAGYKQIIIDTTGPSRSLVTDLEARDKIAARKTQTTSPRDYATACQWFFDAVREGTLTHAAMPGTDPVADAINHATVRPMAGAVGISAPKSTGPVDALRATILASWAAATDTKSTLMIG